jgi:hypothetical protein
VLLGSGEPLFGGIDLHALGYECEKYVAGERAAHVFLQAGVIHRPWSTRFPRAASCAILAATSLILREAFDG